MLRRLAVLLAAAMIVSADATFTNTKVLWGVRAAVANVEALTVDDQGSSYITGATSTAFQPTNRAYGSPPADTAVYGAYVAKYDSAGKLMWSTFLWPGWGNAIAVDSAHNVYI